MSQERYVVTVEYEVFADNRANAVRQFFIDKERFLTVRNAVRQDDPRPNSRTYQHEQTFYDEDGAPVEFELPEGDDSEVLIWLPLDSEE
jgi:hypothetical protein